MEATRAFRDGGHEALLDNLTRAVVGKFDTEGRGWKSESYVTGRERRDLLIHAGHDGGERAVTSVFTDDRERRREGCEASDRESRSGQLSVNRNQSRGSEGETYEPVMKLRNSRRSSSVSSAMTDRTSRTGRLSIEKPWSALVHEVRPSVIGSVS